ncbi:hypothetical protein E8E12_009341 [Didymella heteroderae]|uniref:Uncharacterized protein n=1 Tax=Didymella heteroderae TaxID=1769908 RepID=A0A9P4WZM1_9PLEO|nr:hypothetical protein E8E12_009341 [Didymella heteroderae]
MPSLLDIPRELRDQVCFYVLLSSSATAQPGASQTPDTNSSFEKLTGSRSIYENPRLRAWSRVVLYDPANSRIMPPSLLLVNKQLHYETLSNLELIAKHPNCSMDLIMVDEVVLLPTWTHVPYRHATKFDTVDVTFRISGAYDKKKKYPFDSYKGFRIGDGAGPAMGWQIYAVLERFIRAGTNAEMRTPDAHLHVTARTIRVDVQTPPGVDPRRFTRRPRSGYGRRMQNNGADVLDPEFLASYVKGQVGGLLRSASHEWFTYGQILYEHLDEVIVCKDGTEIGRWDVAECLDARQVESKYFSREEMEEYKRKAWELRRSRGLKMLDGTRAADVTDSNSTGVQLPDYFAY